MKKKDVHGPREGRISECGAQISAEKKTISPGDSYEYYIKVIIYDFQKHLYKMCNSDIFKANCRQLHLHVFNPLIMD